jgi:hypothetical protein
MPPPVDEMPPPVDEMPPPVEGRMPTAEEMEFKKRSGILYAHDVWIICNEFPSMDDYRCPTHLPGLVNSMYQTIGLLGYELVDASDRFNDITHALHLTMTHAQLVHEARTEKKMFIIRRTPANCGALLMQQRLEHVHGQCSEWSPLAYIALVRDIHHAVTRDRVASERGTEQLLIAMARGSDVNVDEGEEGGEEQKGLQGPPRVPNMPAALFKQQMSAMEQMLDAMKVQEESVVEESVVEEVLELTDKEAVPEAAPSPPLSMYEQEMLAEEAMMSVWRQSKERGSE